MQVLQVQRTEFKMNLSQFQNQLLLTYFKYLRTIKRQDTYYIHLSVQTDKMDTVLALSEKKWEKLALDVNSPPCCLKGYKLARLKPSLKLIITAELGYCLHRDLDKMTAGMPGSLRLLSWTRSLTCLWQDIIKDTPIHELIMGDNKTFAKRIQDLLEKNQMLKEEIQRLTRDNEALAQQKMLLEEQLINAPMIENNTETLTAEIRKLKETREILLKDLEVTKRELDKESGELHLAIEKYSQLFQIHSDFKEEYDELSIDYNRLFKAYYLLQQKDQQSPPQITNESQNEPLPGDQAEIMRRQNEEYAALVAYRNRASRKIESFAALSSNYNC